MKAAVIAFSVCGGELAARIVEALAAEGDEAQGYIAARHAAEQVLLEPFDSVFGLTERLYSEMDALVFVGACGIAVRAIAPHVRSKLTDPAVVVCDETGRFAISLLSGHVGGANALAGRIAEAVGAMAVVTTASDVHTQGVELPQDLVLGLGCRRGLAAETIERAVTVLLWDEGIPLVRVCEAATIDIKRDEEGLLGFAQAHRLPLRFYSAQELAAVPGEFTASERVLRTVGVDNVCERAAALCGGTGNLVLRKTAKDGVTVAVFEKE